LIIQKYIEENTVYENFNYGKLFYKNDKSFENFSFCNKKLVEIQEKIQNLERIKH